LISGEIGGNSIENSENYFWKIVGNFPDPFPQDHPVKNHNFPILMCKNFPDSENSEKPGKFLKKPGKSDLVKSVEIFSI
jgi:hypothetical protein